MKIDVPDFKLFSFDSPIQADYQIKRAWFSGGNK